MSKTELINSRVPVGLKLSVEDMLGEFNAEYDHTRLIGHLRANPDKIVDFCLELGNQYAAQDPAALIVLGTLIVELVGE